MHEKDFSDWSLEKQNIHENKERPFFHEREIWFTQLGKNIGYEQDGRGNNFLRPVVVLKKFNNEVLLAVPLTTSCKVGKHYFSFSFEADETSTAILSQIRLIDAKRFQYKVGNISKADFFELKEKLKQLIA